MTDTNIDNKLKKPACKKCYVNVYYCHVYGYTGRISKKKENNTDNLVDDWEICLYAPPDNLYRLVIVDSDQYYEGFYKEKLKYMLYNNDFNNINDAVEKLSEIKEKCKKQDYSWCNYSFDNDEAYLVYGIYDNKFKFEKVGVVDDDKEL